MLINVQSTLRVGDTLVRLIVMSDGTHRSNSPAEKKGCPLNMTIGNLSPKIRQMPSTYTILMVTLLPIPIKNHNIAKTRLDEQRQTIREVPKKVLQWVFQSLTFTQFPAP
jgi:hypothetical protein